MITEMSMLHISHTEIFSLHFKSDGLQKAGVIM